MPEKSQTSSSPSAGAPTAKEQLKERFDYWKALGRFIDAFALLELWVAALLAKTSGFSDFEANAAYGNINLAGRISRIRALYACRGQNLPDELDFALTQVDKLAQARNAILHHGAIHWDATGKRQVIKYTQATTHDGLRPFIEDVTPDLLRSLRTDTVKATCVIMVRLRQKRLLSAHHRRILEGPWFFTLPTQRHLSPSKQARKERRSSQLLK